VTDKVLEVLRGGVDEHPEYYLDEIAEELLIRTQIHLPICTIYKTLTEKALQRNESHRRLYKKALKCLVKDPRQLVFIDETHKDKNASRRRRA